MQQEHLRTEREPIVVYSHPCETSDITEQRKIDPMSPGGMWVELFQGRGKERDCQSLLQAVISAEKEEKVSRGQRG